MKLITIILACAVLSGCIESPAFYKAENKFNAAHTDWKAARARGDYNGMRDAFACEIEALEEETESCWWRTKDRWRVEVARLKERGR